ncbi:MAG: hypothetical protein K8I29_09225 [Alphaproteobacteria bacterium]|uniref:Uncharacterized protein n=1 Tax=Candidatus Nitrobium versatile TaxID=2884831 RepID=A0A953JB59_9BACT|nr:hypothetical protein [Candidatus Nitrobium versatile]
MCMATEIRCTCGSKSASLHFRDNILSDQAVGKLYCPDCASGIRFDPSRMVVDNGWVIEYDMDIVHFMGHKIPGPRVTPDLLFDEGYCTWNGIYPGDHIDSVKEREQIVALMKTNPARYIQEMKSWVQQRMARLQCEGWRKAKNGDAPCG